MKRTEEEVVKIMELMKQHSLSVLLISGFKFKPSILNRWRIFEQLFSKMIFTILEEPSPIF